jgi:two-component system phosphate regulon sensor histidine kinase PhoR
VGAIRQCVKPLLADDIFKTLAQPGIRPHIDVAGFLVGNVNQTTFRRAMWFAAIGIAAGSALVAAIGMAGLWVSVAVAIAVACLGMLLPGNAPELNDSVSLIDGGQHHVPRIARDVFERLPDPLMLLGSGGRVAYANDAMRALVGIDVENKPVSAVLRTPAVLEAIDHASETGEQSSFEFVLHVPVERHYSAYVSRAQDAPRLTALLLHDLTAVKRAEEARADFIANASHELRTPLAAVSGFIDTLRGHAKDDEEARDKFLHIMSVEAGRMRRLIEDLLSLTRIELNEHVPPAGQADVTSVVRDAAAILGPLAEADGVTVTVENAAPVPLVVGERDELMQLFQNLIHNAIKYGKRGGHVWIDIEPAASPVPGRGQAESMIAIRIRDDGEGVAREAIPRLTERFYRVDVKRSRERGGTGLGLAIVKHIIARHQGRLQIESEVGEGSTFTVFLPAREKGATVTELL